jgi:hypothetical protein
MPRPTMEFIPFVDKVVDHIEKGDLALAYNLVADLPKKQAMAAVAYIIERSPEAGPKWSFLRFLESRAGL